MPIYEYRCLDCRRRFSVFYRSIRAAGGTATCPRCGGTRTERLMSRVYWIRGEAGTAGMGDDDFGELDGLDDGDEFEDDASPFDMDDEGLPDVDDPRELAQWTRRMSQQLGEPLDPQLDQALSDLERGADPEEVLERLESEPGSPVDDELD